MFTILLLLEIQHNELTEGKPTRFPFLSHLSLYITFVAAWLIL